MSMNIIFVGGRLATEPALTTVNDAACTTFTLASDTRARDQDGKYIPIFYRVTAWRRLGENVAQYLHKGDAVTVAGDLSQRSYVDREGQNRTSLQITASHVEFPGKRSAAPTAQEQAAPALASQDDDSLPF